MKGFQMIILILAIVDIAWMYSCPQHMMILIMALDKLSKDNRQIVISALSEAGMKVGRQITYQSFEQAACWADDILRRSSDSSKYKPQIHYIDIPYFDDSNFTDESAQTISEINAVNFLNEVKGRLLNSSASTEEPTEEFSKDLRAFVHVLEDIHQPMHTISRFNSKYHNGDNGGNIIIRVGRKEMKLHALLDTTMNKLDKSILKKGKIGWGFSKEAIQYLREVGKRIDEEFPKSKIKKDLTKISYKEMADATHDIAEKNAYTNITENSEVSDEYLEKGWAISKKLMSIAANRLADELTEIFSFNSRILSRPDDRDYYEDQDANEKNNDVENNRKPQETNKKHQRIYQNRMNSRKRMRVFERSFFDAL